MFNLFDMGPETPVLGQVAGAAKSIMDPNSELSQAAGAFLPDTYLNTVRTMLGSMQNGSFDMKDPFHSLLSGMTGLPYEHVQQMAKEPHKPLWEAFPDHYRRPEWANNMAANGQTRA